MHNKIILTETNKEIAFIKICIDNVNKVIEDVIPEAKERIKLIDLMISLEFKLFELEFQKEVRHELGIQGGLRED